MYKKFINQQNRLFKQLKRAIEFIIENGRFGDWADIRTSATATWALSNCLIQNKKRGYIEGTIRRLLNSTECETDEDGLCFNYEAWDTSLVLLAINSSGLKNFKKVKKEIQSWLHSEFNLDSVRDEPWETLWTLLALLSSEENPDKNSKRYINSINWILKRRTAEGILISAHYCGILSAVLNFAQKKLNLRNELINKYQTAQNISLQFILKEYKSGLKEDRLWRDEPWQIGHILFGISQSGKFSQPLYLDFSFNEELEAGLQNLWEDGKGWVDMADTSGLALGLSSYLFARSNYLMSLEKKPELIHQKNFYETISFYRNISGMIPKVFISYSSKDKKYADRLAELLKKRGVITWYDKNEILAGHSIADKVYKGIRDSDYLAIILTQNSVESKWVKHELNSAKVKEIQGDKEVVILPLLFEDCDIPTILGDKLYANFIDSFNDGFMEMMKVLLPDNIYVEGGPKAYKKYPLTSELLQKYKECHFCGRGNIIGAIIDAVSDKGNPNILCEDCGNWI